MPRPFKADFGERIARVHRHHRKAAEPLIRHDEPEVRVEVRFPLHPRDPGPRQGPDPIEVCQAVLSEFGERVTRDDLDENNPTHRIRLLVGTTRETGTERARFRQHARRDVRTAIALDERPSTVARREPRDESQRGVPAARHQQFQRAVSRIVAGSATTRLATRFWPARGRLA